MEIYPGIHRIEIAYQDRYLYQHILVGDKRMLIVDAGIVSTPEQYIIPYIKEHQLVRENMKVYLLVTHNDTDHCGGNANLQKAFPEMTIMAHKFESEDLEIPEQIVKNRYNEFAEYGISYSKDRNEQILKNLGGRCEIDLRLVGGEQFRLSDDWLVEFHHAPGHTKGHMMIHDKKNQLGIITDAILGKGVIARSGELSLCPTNRYITEYKKTIQHIESLQLDALLTSHFPLIAGGESVRQFIAESKEFVEEVESFLLSQLKQNKQLTVLQLIANAGEQLGAWPIEKNFELHYCFHGGLEDLESRKVVKRVIEGNEMRWEKI